MSAMTSNSWLTFVIRLSFLPVYHCGCDTCSGYGEAGHPVAVETLAVDAEKLAELCHLGYEVDINLGVGNSSDSCAISCVTPSRPNDGLTYVTMLS